MVSDLKILSHNDIDCLKADIREFAKIWHLKGPVVHSKLGRRSHGEEWFKDTLGKHYYTFDSTGHRGGVWEIYGKKENRLMAIDMNGQVVGD